MNKVIENISIQNYRNFKLSFENIRDVFWDTEKSKLTHPSEFGAYREELAKKWLRSYIPNKFNIGSGFIISPHGYISSQCDLIIYDRFLTPKIENIDNQRFFPIEGVAGVIEIKSDIQSIKKFNEYLIKLSEIKKVRAGLKWQDPHNRSFQSEYSPESNPFDNIFTILICNKFDFVFDISKINYGKTRQQYKHNLVLSLNDGLLHYKKSGSSTSLYFPFNKDNVHVNEFLKNDKSDLPKTIKIFLSSLYSILNLTSILNIDMGLYLFDEKDVVDKIA